MTADGTKPARKNIQRSRRVLIARSEVEEAAKQADQLTKIRGVLESAMRNTPAGFFIASDLVLMQICNVLGIEHPQIDPRA